jgi:dihydrodipicolinate synthase/N-acetylneuraminate lyase
VGAHGPDGDPAGSLARHIGGGTAGAFFKAILDAANGLPCVIYNSPYYGFATRADLFFDLRRDFPNLIGFKEFGGADDLRYAGENITSKADDVLLMVGVDT